jgi:FKBP-type peptidyl-prolyl cis-trans isomerase FklB
MKKMLLLAAVAVMVFTACTTSSVKNARISDKQDSLSYAFGVNTYFGMQQENIEVDPILMAKGMLDSKNGENIMHEEIARGFIVTYFQERDEAEMKEMYKESIDENEKFMADNKIRPGITTTESGLQYEVEKMGTGPKPGPESVVKVHYTGMLTNGEVFDSSIGGEPIELAVSGVINGWIEGLQLMPVGSKFKFFIPHTLAYGAGGAGGVIPPYATLIFDVELLEIVNQ